MILLHSFLSKFIDFHRISLIFSEQMVAVGLMDGMTEGREDGKKVGRMDGPTDRPTDSKMDGQSRALRFAKTHGVSNRYQHC